MQYIAFSGIHENFHNLQIALDYANKHSISAGFVLGDLINPGIMHKLGESGLDLKGPTGQ